MPNAIRRLSSQNSLTEGSITKSIILFSIPILLSNLFQQLYNSVDTAVVGKFSGSAALAAVGSTGFIINLLIGFFLGVSTGTGVLFSMHYGAGNYPKLKRLVDSSMIISVVSGVFITAVGIIFCTPILQLLDTPDDVLPLARQYLIIYFTGTIANLIYNVGSGIIRSEGDSTRPLVYLVIGGVLNLILDLLLVAVFHTGVIGAAVATVAAQLISAILVVIRMTRMNPIYRLDLLHIRADWETSKEIIRISVPCGIQSSMINLANVLVQAKINSFGKYTMAGIAAYMKIDAFGYTSIHALGLAISTYVGQNIGANQYRRAQKGIRICILCSVSVSIVVTILVALFCEPLLHLFTDDQPAVDVGLQMMHHVIPFIWLMSFMEILGSAIRGSGQATPVTVISAISICLFRVVWLIVMLRFFNDPRIVYLCYPISWLLNTIALLFFYFRRSVLRKDIKAEIAASGKL